MTGLPRERVCHLDIWMGCGPGMSSVRWRWHLTLRSQDQQQFAKRKWGEVGRTRCSRKGEQAGHSWDVRNRTALEGPAGPQGCGFCVWTCELLLFFLILLPNPDICMLQFISSSILYLILTYEIYVAPPFHRWGTRGQAMSHGSARLRESGLCSPSKPLPSPQLPEKVSGLHALTTLGQKVIGKLMEVWGTEFRHSCRVIKHAGAKADRPGLKCQLCHELAVIWSWASYLTSHWYLTLVLPASPAGVVPHSSRVSPSAKMGVGGNVSSSDAWYHCDNHRPCPLSPLGPAILCYFCRIGDLGIFCESAYSRPA